jgi:hypothetical protein
MAGSVGLLLFFLAVATQYVGATYGSGGLVPPACRFAEDAPARIVEGVPVVRLAGSRREVGRLHGALLKEQIHFLFREYFQALAVPTVGRKNLDDWAREVEPFLPKGYREELEGLAQGAGLEYRDVLLVNTMVDRLQELLCSTVAAGPEGTKGSEVILGRNLDFFGRNLLHRATVVVVFEPEGETPVAAVTWPGLVGILSGMSRRGVAGATMMIHQGKTIRPGVPYMIMYREALAGAEKTADVFEYIEGAKRTVPNNFMVVDASGAAEVLEIDQDRVERRNANEGGLCSTNHFRSEPLKDVGWPIGMSRYRSLEAFLRREWGRIDLDGVKRVLADVARPWFLNVQAMIFLPARAEIHVTVGPRLPAASQRWVHLRRDVLFGTAGSER